MDKLSKIVVGLFQNMFMVVVLSKIYPACQTDENGIKPGSDLDKADKHVAEPCGTECLGIK